jgi:hypothetical protein
MPLIFTAVGRARLRIRQALPGGHHSRETSVTRGEPECARSTAERSDRLLGRPTAGKPSRLVTGGNATGATMYRPILPWALLVFFQACRVLFHSTPRRSFVERVSFARSAVRRGPLSVGRHPLMGFACD